jgi:signal transduction histidine kinase
VELLELEVHGPVTKAQREDLNRITRSSKHLLALINDILDFTKIEAGHIELDIEELSVRDVLTGVGAFVEPQVRSGKLEYSLGDCDPALRVRADRDRLDQILLNLLTNAIKFTAPGGSIRIECVADDGAVRFRVHDTGRGIPAERLDTVFEPFVQVAQHSPRASRQGIGLGLTISRELARAMHGDLTVTSVVGQGSSFTLELPRAGGS